mgnify:FL=1
MKKILITGANSYIGTSFESYIKENFTEQYLVDTVDMLDGSWREKSFTGYDSVFHVAGIAHQKETKENAHLYYEVNRDLAIKTAQKAKKEGVKQFIFLSSMSVYGKNTGIITEETLIAPKSHYGKSKVEAEKGIKDLQSTEFQVAILRPPMIYGKGCRGNYQTLVKLALKLPIFPYVKNRRSMLYIENLCEFVRLLVDRGESGLFCPQNGEYSNTSEMVKMIAEAHGKKIRLIKGFGWLIKFFGLFSKTLQKAFGNLIYEQKMGEYPRNYCVKELMTSIKE